MCSNRLDRCKCGLGHADELLVRDRWFCPFTDRLGESGHFVLPTFVLCATLHTLLSIFDSGQRNIIIQHRDHAFAKYFESFLGMGFVAIGKIVHNANGTIGEGESHGDIVLAIFALIRQRVRDHADRGCADEEADQIYKVTCFADDPSAAEVGVLSPVVEWKIADVDSVVGMKRLVTSDE